MTLLEAALVASGVVDDKLAAERALAEKALAPAIAGLPAWYVEAQLVKFKSGQRGLHAQDTGGLRMYPMSLTLKRPENVQAVAAFVAAMPTVTPAHTLTVADAARFFSYRRDGVTGRMATLIWIRE